MTIDDRTRAKIITDYKAGARTIDLLEKYKIQRGSLYHLLRKEGVPLRQPRMATPESQRPSATTESMVEYLLHRVRELEAEVARLRATEGEIPDVS